MRRRYAFRLPIEDFKPTPVADDADTLPEPPLGALYGVPTLPPHFLGRPELLRRVKEALLVDLQKPVVITGSGSRVGVQGMGGIGKSVLAAALAPGALAQAPERGKPSAELQNFVRSSYMAREIFDTLEADKPR